MNQLHLYNRILNLTSLWSVSAVELNEANEHILVTVSFNKAAELCCPKCSQPSRLYDVRKRQWRHLDTCQFQTFIEADIPRVICSEHGVLTLQVPWAEGSSHYSRMFENHIVSLAQSTSYLTVSKQVKLSWSCIDRIIKRAVMRGLSRRWEVDCRHLSVDETSISKRHEYITVLSNSQGQVLAIADGRASQSLLMCFKSLPIQFLSKAQTISMDMSPAYIKATKHFFGARYRRMISIDHFHIAKLLTKAVEHIRKEDAKTLPSLERMRFHKGRYCWLKKGTALSEGTLQELNYQRTLMIKTSMAWVLKEKARDIWYGVEPPTRCSWVKWFGLVRDSGLKPLEMVASTIRKHLDGIMTSMRTKTSNARAEAINKNIKNVGRVAHGFRNKERYKSAIFLRYGKLTTELAH